jgi:Ca-activated chloride channel family protein
MAADMFLTYLRGPAGRTALTAAGFRDADGTNPRFTAARGVLPTPPRTAAVTPTGATLESARNLFRKINQRGTTLAVIDVSGSMGDPVPGTGKTRLQVTVEAGRAALPLFAPDSRLGLWEFSTRLDGAKDYRELVPIGAMADRLDGHTRRDVVNAALGVMRPRADTGLYDTALAAYEQMTRSYTPGRLNEVVLLTDGKNDDPGSITQQALLTKLREEYDPAKPVRLITIAFGTQADTDALRQISAATHARSYESRDPNAILDVFINALTE